MQFLATHRFLGICKVEVHVFAKNWSQTVENAFPQI